MAGFQEGVAYRHPKFFGRIIPNAAHVTVEGNWPAVVDAYKAAGIDVEVVGAAVERQLAETMGHSDQASGIDQAIQPKDAVLLPVDDGLDDLGAEQLHALAKERGVKVRSNASADKVRAVLREVGP
ncbi:hypothetical protein [Kerstersia gyiorum]|uniref:hypothetical protein n=1 Tax=Kerstersia gyiorum TaxID=206506 RepID=UPI0030CAE732